MDISGNIGSLIGSLAITAILAFLLGSIPSGLWVGRLGCGIDVREHGSKNLGATNVYRTLGRGWGLLVLLLDGFKGWAAVTWAPGLAVAVSRSLGLGAPAEPGSAAGMAVTLALLAMVGAALGHMFSPFASFRGGKGVATVAGGWLALAAPALLVALGTWILVFALSRIVSLASILGALALPLGVSATVGAGGEAAPLFWASVAIAGLVVLRHGSNISRLRQRREAPLDLRGGTASPPSSRRRTELP